MSTSHAVVKLSHALPIEYLNGVLYQCPPRPSGRMATPPEADPVDMTRLSDMVDNDSAGMRELVDLYLSESGELMGSLRAAIEAGSATEAEWIAHKLGGSSATCGMIGIVAPLRELEVSGKAGQWPENEQLLREAGRQHDRICAYLAAHVLKN